MFNKEENFSDNIKPLPNFHQGSIGQNWIPVMP